MAKIAKKHGKTLIIVFVLVVTSVVLQMQTAGKYFSSDKLVVWFFDVGQGDAIFIDAPNKQVLIDGGRDRVVLEKLSAVMPFWDRSIDYVLVTHPHADHVTGLDYVLDDYFVSNVWSNGQGYDTDEYLYFEKFVTDNEVKEGYKIDLGNGASLKIIYPAKELNGKYFEDPNDGSLVAWLLYNNTSILLTGDVGKEQEWEMVDELKDVDILKVGHHGSLTSSSMEFLKEISPEYAIISVGDNDYGHPNPVVVSRFLNLGINVFRTDQDGDVRVVLDKNGYKIKLFNL